MTTRSVCFTIFEPSWAHEVLYDPAIKCAIVQQEKCPESGKLHFQGYMQLVSPMRFAGIKKLLQCDSAHLESAKGTPQQAWDYCCKDDTRVDGPWTYGERPKGQGNRCVTASRHEVAGNTSRHFACTNAGPDDGAEASTSALWPTWDSSGESQSTYATYAGDMGSWCVA